jgi:hypothetical protein
MRYALRREPKRGSESERKPQSGLTSQGKAAVLVSSASSLGPSCSSSFRKKETARRERPSAP